MHTFKRYLAVIVGLVLAVAAAFLHAKYAWPPGLNLLSKMEQEFLMLEPGMESCAVFFVVLRRSSTFVAFRLGVIGRQEELIQDTQGQIPAAEILAAVFVLMFRGFIRLNPGPFTAVDYSMIAFAIVNLGRNIHEVVRRQTESAS